MSTLDSLEHVTKILQDKLQKLKEQADLKKAKKYYPELQTYPKNLQVNAQGTTTTTIAADTEAIYCQRDCNYCINAL